VLYTDEAKSHRAVTEATAFLMSSMLADVINAGTASKARQVGFTLPAAGKTGTTNDYVDAWFIGYTPHLVTGVWVGFDQPSTITSNGYAGDIAVPLWASFMKVATKGDKPEWFDRPSNVIGVNVCRLSGQLPNDGCNSVEVVNRDGGTESRSMIYTEYFVTGTQPTEKCPLHPSSSMMDKLAGLFGAHSEPPVPPEQAGVPAPEHRGTTGVPGAAPSADSSDDIHGGTATDETPKKRGFWSKVFGKKDKGDDDKNKKEDKKKSE
jgi:membrane peptidoglycan carboxypeptidase